MNGGKKCGTTLLETLISTAIFALLVLAVFIFFDIGRAKWSWMNLGRQLGTDARVAIGTLERDLRRTTFSSVDIYSSPVVTPPGWDTATVPRWAICFVGADDPLDPNHFNPVTGEPIWTKYIIYMATTQTNQGTQEGVGGAGSGFFLRIVSKFNASATNPLPLHNPVFVPSVDWVNNNEFGNKPENKENPARIPWRDRPAQNLPLEEKLAGLDFRQRMLIAGGMYNTNPDSPSPNTIPTNQPYGPATDPAVEKVIATPDPSQAQFNLTGLINTSLAANNPPTNLQLAPGGVTVSVVSNVFALMFAKDDSTRTVAITFKTKGYTNRGPSGVSGYESRQVDLVVATEYWNAR